MVFSVRSARSCGWSCIQARMRSRTSSWQVRSGLASSGPVRSSVARPTATRWRSSGVRIGPGRSRAHTRSCSRCEGDGIIGHGDHPQQAAGVRAGIADELIERGGERIVQVGQLLRIPGSVANKAGS